MSMFTRLIELLRRVSPRASDADLDDELRFHVDMEAAALQRRGLSPVAAREEARRRFGGVDRYGEEVRDVRGGRWLEWLARDTRHALRMARRFPGFTAIVLVTLGGAIGANTAIFTIIDATLLRALPFPEPEQLVALYAQNPDKSLPRFSVSYADYLDWKRETRSFADMAAFGSTTLTLSGGQGDPERLAGLVVTSNFFDVLGARPALGRLFGAQDAAGEASDAVILTAPFWTRRFGGDSAIIGKSVQFAARSRVVIGILPDTFRLDGRTIDAVTVLAASTLPGVENHGQHLLESIARLKPGVSLASAQQDLAGVAERLAIAHPEIRGWSANVFRYRDELTRGVKQPLLILLAAAGLVLLIGCTNVASLLITRGAARGREVALRQALGASRARLVSQLLIESGVLALGGGVLGIAVAGAGTRALVRLAPPGLIPAGSIGMDLRVLAFALGLSVLTAALLGVWPAVRASSARLIETLHDGGRTNAGSMHAARLRRLLVVAETALALVLLVCSALVLQSLSNILGVDPGFQVDRVVTMRITLTPAAYPDSAPVAFYRELTSRLVGRAGIDAAAAANTPPLALGGVVPPIRPLGRPNASNEPMTSPTTAITPGYFRAAGIRLIAGRDIAWSDPVPKLLLSQSAARRLWPGEDVLGKRIAFGQRDTVGLEIVGVVSDSRARGLTVDPVPMIYMSFGGALNVVRTMTVLIRGSGDPASLITATRTVVHELDPKLPLYSVQTLRQIVDQSIAQPRLNTTLLALFAAMALLLASIGIYGVVSYTVALRSRELGVRMALGAQRRDVLQLVLREGAGLALAGVVLGVVASFGATRVIRSWLFGIGAGDVTTLVATSVALVTIAILASYVPARRATHVDPTLAMRAE